MVPVTEKSAGILSNQNPFDLIQRELLRGTIIDLGRSCGIMPGNARRCFQLTAIAQEFGDTRAPKRMIANLRGQSRFQRATLHHLQGRVSRHRLVHYLPLHHSVSGTLHKLKTIWTMINHSRLIGAKVLR